jgi:hypothetical protein
VPFEVIAQNASQDNASQAKAANIGEDGLPF